MKVHLFTIALCCAAFAQDLQPERKVSGQVIHSEQQPAANIEIASGLRYLGAQRFVLYGVANCEQHLFVDATPDGTIKRLVWVQFEGYLPDKPHRYDYSSNERSTMNGLDVFVRGGAAPTNNPTRAGSDTEHVRNYLAAKGLRLPAEVLTQRIVSLTDEAKRNELMFIYMEDLAPLKVSAADLNKGGAAEERWPEIKAGLLERAKAAITVRPKS
jgi:hypothetical protein